MSWKDLIAAEDKRVLPWTGGRSISDKGRSWNIVGKLPREHGWYTFNLGGGRKATLVGQAEQDPSYDEGRGTVVGYLVGNRIIPDDARVDPDPKKLAEQTQEVHLVEIGLEQFTRALVVKTGLDQKTLVFFRQEFPLGPEGETLMAYQDRLKNLDHVQGVTPALDLAFRWVNVQRELAEERQRELERQRAAEEAERQRQEMIAEARKSIGTGAGRRALATAGDFEAAARAALAVSGSELLATRASRAYKTGMVVQYRFRKRRFECVADKYTLRIIDAGICLTNHATGEKSDTKFTLESLPGVIGWIIDDPHLHLVVWRHIDGQRR